MKKVIITLSIVAALAFNANAQKSSDGFFSTYTMEEETRGAMPNLPGQGIGKDQDAPVGSGLLLLAGLGLAYAMKSRKDEE